MHWEQLGNVLDRPSQLRLPPSIPASRGVYAPTIRHHGGRFYVITTLVGAGGTFLISSDRPEGPWSDPVWSDLPGIDPDLAWGAPVRSSRRRRTSTTSAIAEGGTARGPGAGAAAAGARHRRSRRFRRRRGWGRRRNADR
ncbi:family 43 glycosylhydrolase [Nonomuraea sp. NPDC049141]|uniref:family 43 glycosylhydrolase n=1 Tax=Nonomuraea sp. NPDC049141 TaxID=3155500 RepID=UPI0033F47457